MMPMAFAQEALPEAGITPDSGFLWGIDVALDNIGMVLSPAYGIKVATERLSEIKAMADKGDIVSASKAEEERQKALAVGIGAISVAEAESVLEIHINVLKQVLAKVPTEAQNSIQNAIDKSQEGLIKAREIKSLEGGEAKAVEVTPIYGARQKP